MEPITGTLTYKIVDGFVECNTLLNTNESIAVNMNSFGAGSQNINRMGSKKDGYHLDFVISIGGNTSLNLKTNNNFIGSIQVISKWIIIPSENINLDGQTNTRKGVVTVITHGENINLTVIDLNTNQSSLLTP